MPPIKHALLGASSAHRWLNCPPSARLTENMPDTPSEYAAAGTLAHEIAELKARNYFIETLSKCAYNSRLKNLQASEHYDKGMDSATDEYLEHLKARAMTYPSAPAVALEVRVDFSDIVPDGYGTADCVMIGSGCLDIIDYKNGAGVVVEAENNPQMMLYAWGALNLYRPIFGDTIDRVHMSIVQPNAGGVREFECAAANLKTWVDGEVILKAAQAIKGEGDFNPGDWCRFCKAKAQCSARAAKMLELEPLAEVAAMPVSRAEKLGLIGETSVLTDAEIGDILTRAQNIAAWVKDLESYALTASLEGRQIAGWKAVEGRGTREWKGGTDTAFDHLQERGVPRALLYEEKPVSVAGLEKSMGKKVFAETAEGLWVKKPGKPTLVPESDGRPAYNAAETAFEKVNPDV